MRDNFHVRYWLRLSLADGVGSRVMRRLLAAFESPAAVLGAGAAALRRYVPERTALSIVARDKEAQVREALAWAARDGNALVTLADEGYPAPLLEIADPPPVLFARGNLGLLKLPAVALVGSRNASAPGRRSTRIFARHLAQAGCAVVSGLAQGVDAAAHQGALEGEGGGTIAVVGTGIDLVYPRENRRLAAQIGEEGLILSEFALGTPPVQGNFPRRNRVISGLSRACVVMEATIKSGSLITARLALDQGRDVFAVPGSIDSPLHRGCHRLIRQGEAKLAGSVRDVLEDLGMAAPGGRGQAALNYEEAMGAGVAAGTEGDVLAFVHFQPTSVDDIAARSGIAADSLMSALLELEMAGKIVPTAGGGYQRV